MTVGSGSVRSGRAGGFKVTRTALSCWVTVRAGRSLAGGLRKEISLSPGTWPRSSTSRYWRRGKRSPSEFDCEHCPRFRRLRRRYVSVESAIDALEVRSLDRCPDHVLDGFKRYVALAARNLHRLGRPCSPSKPRPSGGADDAPPKAHFRFIGAAPRDKCLNSKACN